MNAAPSPPTPAPANRTAAGAQPGREAVPRKRPFFAPQAGEGPPACDATVDASGLTCPLPILRAKKALAQLASGQILHITTTDPHAVRDFQAFCRQTGNPLIAQIKSDAQPDTVQHYLQRR